MVAHLQLRLPENKPIDDQSSLPNNFIYYVELFVRFYQIINILPNYFVIRSFFLKFCWIFFISTKFMVIIHRIWELNYNNLCICKIKEFLKRYKKINKKIIIIINNSLIQKIIKFCSMKIIFFLSISIYPDQKSDKINKK